MNVHFIAIGGSAMHNLAIALKKAGNQVTGSDDEIFEPSLTRLNRYGLLPEKQGWFPGKIHPHLDAIIVGMHARADNPELLRAKELQLNIYSYPEFLYQQSLHKTRIVVGGSHGKTTITAMILHAMKLNNLKTDFMVGAQLEGFDIMVELSNDTKYMVMEGDEYPSSPIDLRPKFHLYKPHIAILSGIAWDHINVFPTWEFYLQQFRIFIETIEQNGVLVYCQDDAILHELVQQSTRNDLTLIPYSLPDYRQSKDKTVIVQDGNEFEMNIFGKHNMHNINAAKSVCKVLGISETDFLRAISSFKGASKRLEKIVETNAVIAFIDFAHAPSKLKATTQAVREQFPDWNFVACMELHTFSSLNKAFLQQYEGSMDSADKALVYFSPHALQMKKLPDLKKEDVAMAFKNEELEVFNNSDALLQRIEELATNKTCFLFMSSGNFGGVDVRAFSKSLAQSIASKQ